MITSRCLVVLCLCLVPLKDARSVGRKGILIPNEEVESWRGKWFPFAPNEHPPEDQTTQTSVTAYDRDCDSKENIAIDYNPQDARHSFNYLCLSNRTIFYPNLQTKAVLTEHFIPPAYVASIRCLNESIHYGQKIPAFGAFRLLPPKYGTYKYLPPQRWLRSLAEGAIVMLHHPCANSQQVNLLRKIMEGCLYRHIVTPSQFLTPERPIALLAWGKSLEMSVLDEKMVLSFVKEHAKHGPIAFSGNANADFYEADLLTESHLVTDKDDSEICGYYEM